MKIGVVSDTHNFFDPQIPLLLKGVAHILHAGDIGKPAILEALEELAPVTAVIGNTDEMAFGYPLTKVVTLDGRKFLLHHIVNPHALSAPLREKLDSEQPDVVVFGHSHKPFSETIGGTLFFNPGYAGKPRFALPRSVAILHSSQEGLRPEYSVL